MKKLHFISACLLWSGMASAQERIATYSDKKTDRWTVRIYENDPLHVREYTLKNGLRVITSVNHAQPRISTMIAVKTGSKNDPADHTGLAHYLEHMLFKGTDKYGTLDWDKEKPLLDKIDSLYEVYNHQTDTLLRKHTYHAIDSMSQLAAKWAIANEYDKMCQAMGAEGTNAFTSVEQTVYINDIPANMLAKWLNLESERYRNPVLRLFHTELEAVYEEKNMSLDRDGDKVEEGMNAALFTKHNYGKQTTIGTVEHLKNPSLKAIREYYHKYYVSNNMAIILSGDLEPDSAVAMIAEKFAWMQPKDVPAYEFEPEYPHARPQKITVVGQDAESLTMGFRLPGANTREIRAIRLIDLLLNNASAGLIDLNLVKQQKVLSAGSRVDIMNDYSVFVLSGKPREGQTLDSVKTLLLREVKRIQDGEFDDSLLQAILLNEDINRIAGFKNDGARCNFLLESFVNGSGYQKSYNELWEMRKIRKEEIMEIAKELLGNDRVEVYKLQGTDTAVVKITKPEIHPVELNRDKQSTFVSKWLEIPVKPISPEYPDFAGGITKTEISPQCPLYYVKNPDNRLFSINYRYEEGRFHQKALPIALDYLKYLGTRDFTAEAFSKKMYALGCSFYTYADERKSYFIIRGPEENFDQATALVESLISDPKADENAFHDYVNSIKKRRSDAKKSKRSIERMLAEYTEYGADNPSRWTPDMKELDKLRPEDLLQLLKDLLNAPQQIEYYGQRDAASLVQKLKEVHRIPQKFRTIAAPKEFIPAEHKENTVYFVSNPQVQATIFWMRRDEIFDPAKTPVIDAFNQYFGGDMSSVVFQNIRESKALAYGTYAFYSIPDRKGEYNTEIAYIGCQADKFKDAFAAMTDLLNKLQVDDNVFALSKESLKSQIENTRIENDQLLDYYFGVTELGYDHDPRQDKYAALDKIEAKEIEKFHKKHMAGKTWGIGILADDTRIKVKDLEKYGVLKTLTLEEIFGY